MIEEAIGLLSLIRETIKAMGFPKTDDPSLLRKLYGLDHNGVVSVCLWRIFRYYADGAAKAPNGNERPAYLDELKKKAIQLFDKEIEVLQMRAELQQSIDREKIACDSTAAMIRSQDAMHLLVRYEAHLSREFDRILNQLERVQRMRRGQPGPPTLNLNIG